MIVAIIGYGKMGREVERILTEKGHTAELIIDADNAADLCAEKMKNVDVAIEFSTPDTALGNIKKCLEIGTPVVCGTTGWLAQKPEIEALCREKSGAFFYASNYSIGVNVAMELNRRLATMMNRFPEYDVTIEETHHTAKKDAPSGTAITLAEDILGLLDRKTSWVSGVPTAPDELGIASIRRSVAPGDHTVIYESPTDRIVLTHNIKSRATLAAGAVLAAEFLVGQNGDKKKKGIFSMKDLLGF